MNITIAIYGAISEIVDHPLDVNFKEIGLIVDFLYCCGLLLIFCDCSHNATLEVAKGIQETLLTIDTSKVDELTQKEVDLFIQAILMNPAIVSLKGYANVNRELLTSVSFRIFYKNEFLIMISFLDFSQSLQ